MRGKLTKTPARKKDPRETQITPTRSTYVMKKTKERSTIMKKDVQRDLMMQSRSHRAQNREEERSPLTLLSRARRSDDARREMQKDLVMDSLQLGVAQLRKKFGNGENDHSFDEKLIWRGTQATH